MRKGLAMSAFLLTFLSLGGCGGSQRVDYSDNPFIKQSTRYWRLLQTHSWFEFRCDGTGKADWGGDLYDLTFTMTSNNTANVSWGPYKNEKATFRADVDSKGKELNWLSLGGYQHTTINV